MMQKGLRSSVASKILCKTFLKRFFFFIKVSFTLLLTNYTWVGSFKVNKSRYKQCWVTPLFSTGQNLLTEISKKKILAKTID